MFASGSGFFGMMRKEAESESITLAQPSISSSVHPRPLFFVRKKENGSDECDIVESLVSSNGLSEDDKKQFNRKNLYSYSSGSAYQPETPIGVSYNLIVDWESQLLNEIDKKDQPIIEKKVRACCSFTVRKETPKYDQILPCLVKDWNFESLSTESFQIFCSQDGIEDAGRCLGFIDGKLLRHLCRRERNEILVEDKDCTIEGMKKLEVPNFTSHSSFMIPLPCENYEERKYSLNALVGDRNSFYLYNLKENKFESVELNDMTFLSDFGLSMGNYQVIIKEGKRIRVFLHISESLYELRWNEEKLVVVDHLVFLRQKITKILRLGNSILILGSKGNFVYNPSPFDADAKTGTLAHVSVIPENSSDNLIWDDEIMSLINGIDLLKGVSNSIVLTKEVISQLEAKPISECYSEEELFNQYLFKNYIPPKITDALTVTERQPGDNTFRGDVYYECKPGRYNDMEIIAGIKCLENENLKFAISPQYVELKPQDLADYLGAPVMYPSFGGNYAVGYVHDMVGKRRDSDFVLIKSGFQRSFDLRGNDFLAILSPKDATQEVGVSIEVNQEWKELASKKQFRVESNQIRVADYTNRGYVEINNVESGIWSYNQKLENELPAQVIAFNQNYKDTINTSIEQDWNVPEETFAEKLQNSYCISDLTSKTRPLSDDWQVSACGVCVDGGIVGIFDAVHYQDDSVFGIELKGFDKYFKSYDSGWNGKLNTLLSNEGYPLLLPIPFGVMSRDAETGDGTFACLSKVYNGKVVAVKVIIQHSAYP